jgi:hypothetical protein
MATDRSPIGGGVDGVQSFSFYACCYIFLQTTDVYVKKPKDLAYIVGYIYNSRVGKIAR